MGIVGWLNTSAWPGMPLPARSQVVGYVKQVAPACVGYHQVRLDARHALQRLQQSHAVNGAAGP